MSDIIRRELNDLKATVEQTDAMLKQVVVSVAQLTGKVADIDQRMAGMATKKAISDLNSRIDGFSGLLLDSRHR